MTWARPIFCGCHQPLFLKGTQGFLNRATGPHENLNPSILEQFDGAPPQSTADNDIRACIHNNLRRRASSLAVVLSIVRRRFCQIRFRIHRDEKRRLPKMFAHRGCESTVIHRRNRNFHPIPFH